MPNFQCWIPEYGQKREDAYMAHGYNAADAAKAFIQRYEARNAEYPVASGGSLQVAVAEVDGEPEMYRVTGEAVPYYYARRTTAAGSPLREEDPQ